MAHRLMAHRPTEHRRVQRELAEERRILLEGLTRTRTLIAQAYSCFNTACDSDLIESYVFEINALQSRYSYLLRRVKQLDSIPAQRGPSHHQLTPAKELAKPF